jgi:hypothetical protein
MLQAKNHIVLISLSTGGDEARRACHSITLPQHADALLTINNNSYKRALRKVSNMQDRRVIQKDSDFSYDRCNAEPYVSALAAAM